MFRKGGNLYMSGIASVSAYGQYIDLQNYTGDPTENSGSIVLSGSNASELLYTNVGMDIGGALECETSFTIGNASLTEAELEMIDGITAGTAAASKAVVLDGSKNIATIGTIGCGAITSTGASTMGSLNVGGTLACDTSFTLDAVTLNATELGYLDSVTAGTAAASKALVLDASKDVGTIRNLTIDGTFSDGNYTFDTSGNVTGLGTVGCGAITSTSNLQANGTLSLNAGTNTISAAELNVLDAVTAGTAAASKALVLDANKNIGTVNRFTASYAYIGELDVDKINSVTKTETTLEVVDKLIICASGSNASNSDGGGYLVGGTAKGDSAAGMTWDNDTSNIEFSIAGSNEALMSATVFAPATSDGMALGSTSLMWSDAFLASGAVVNFNNGDVTMTHSANTLTVAGGTLATEALTTSTIVASGIIKTDDATEATSTTDGSLQTDGGLSVAKSAVIGDDLDLLSDGAIVSFGAGKDVTLTHKHDEGILLNSTMKLFFEDDSNDDQYIHSAGSGVTAVAAPTEIDLTAPTLDVNASTAVLMSTPSFVVDSATSEKPVLEIKNSNADDEAGILRFNHDSASPGPNDYLGMIEFKGDDDGGNSTEFAAIAGVCLDETNGTEDGAVTVEVMVDGTLTEVAQFWDGTNGLVLPNNSTYGTAKAHSFVTYSDETLKKDITTLANPMDKIMSLRGVSYEWKQDGSKDLGFIAQEVKNVVPEVVYGKTENGGLGIDYARLTALLVEAVKSQQVELSALKKKMDK
jgi:hypothetical protein